MTTTHAPHIIDVDTSGVRVISHEIPLDHVLLFPPFPPLPLDRTLLSYNAFQQRGVYVPPADSLTKPLQTISAGSSNIVLPLVSLDGDLDPVTTSSRRAITKANAWLIGQDGSGWTEPDSTRLHDYDAATPPFTRLMTVMRDFLTTRHEAFMFFRNKRLFDLFRQAVGLRVDYKGPHRPGTGPNAEVYISGRNHSHSEDSSSVDEICVLLTKPETSIRGFLALARKEAEAGWDIKPAYELAEMVAAFMSYVGHCGVFPEPDLASSFAQATNIARAAGGHLQTAKQLEDALANIHGWNRASWSAFGGTYGQPERGGMEKEADAWVSAPANVDTTAYDGGWVVDAVIDSRPEPLTSADATAALAPWLSPLSTSDIRLLHHIPYARRRITALHPPTSENLSVPHFMQSFWRVVTRPAPWTIEERWKVARPRFDDEVSDDEDDTPGAGSLEREEATLPEPDELSIWVEGEGIVEHGEYHLGQALRGRWAVMGKPDGLQWWSFKAKDFVLPSFWQSERP